MCFIVCSLLFKSYTIKVILVNWKSTVNNCYLIYRDTDAKIYSTMLIPPFLCAISSYHGNVLKRQRGGVGGVVSYRHAPASAYRTRNQRTICANSCSHLGPSVNPHEWRNNHERMARDFSQVYSLWVAVHLRLFSSSVVTKHRQW